MRIAYLTNQYPATSHTFIRREIAALEANGHSVLRYAVRRAPQILNDPADVEELAKTLHVLSLDSISLIALATKSAFASPRRAIDAAFSALRFSSASKRGVLRHLAYYIEALVIAAWCRQAGAEHLHVHFGTNPATVGALVSELTRIPFSFTVHGPEEFDRAQEHSLGAKIAKACFVAAVSSFGRSQLMRWAAFDDWAKIHVVHCGLDRAYLDEPGVPILSAPAFLCVARLSEQKGHFVLLKAAAMLRDRGVPFRLTLAGDGPLRGAIEAAIRDLDLGDIVRLTGWMGQAEIRQQIHMSRAMVLPSFAEGLPVVLMESMALRRPVISTYVAGIPELVRSDAGWLIPAGDPAALCDAMHAAATADEATLRCMGEQARQRVIARHDVALSASLIERHIIRGRVGSIAREPSSPHAGQPVRADAVSDEVSEDVRRRAAHATPH
ncbi:glycosyltransferase [Mesorhizobium sp. AR10]|nr:glycosyltransferase [Mesorhizobium sp. AR10]